jgi:hypothetical protein
LGSLNDDDDGHSLRNDVGEIDEDDDDAMMMILIEIATTTARTRLRRRCATLLDDGCGASILSSD